MSFLQLGQCGLLSIGPHLLLMTQSSKDNCYLRSVKLKYNKKFDLDV